MVPPDPHAGVLADFLAATAQPFSKLVLSKPRVAADDLVRVTVRPVTLKGEAQLSFVYTHRTRDITKNLRPADAPAALRTLLADTFANAHLWTDTAELQLLTSKKGRQTLLRHAAAHAAEPRAAHDREKHRYVDQQQPFLNALGVTNEQHQIVPAMARKWKQINKFVEVLDHALAGTALKQADAIDVVDFGSGKGYLTFATHDYLDRVLKRSVRVCGVESRPELVALDNRIAHETDRPKLSFVAGTIQDAALPALDILIALHACDTATDDAIARGIKADAALIVVAPCCQKEIRQQLHAAPVLAPALRHGIFQERQAEFATDALRALLLEWAGYDTKVFEFISTDHTAKNLMIAATKRPGLARGDEAANKIREFAAFYGITAQALARQLQFTF